MIYYYDQKHSEVNDIINASKKFYSHFLIEENNENLWNSEKCFWMVVIAYSIQFAGNKSDFAYSAPFSLPSHI